MSHDKKTESMRSNSDSVSYQWVFSSISNGSAPIQQKSGKACWQPQVDVFETETDFRVIVELAGVKEADIHISVQDHVLHIHGIRENPAHHIKRNYYHMEVNFGPFERAIILPDLADCSEIEANLKDGFLDISIKKQARPRPRKINIRSVDE